MGRLVSVTSPDTGTTAYLYDQAGNLVGKTDAKSQETTYSYDALNRLTVILSVSEGSRVDFTYDQGTNGIGRLTTVVDASGTTNLFYDLRGNVTKETKIIGGTSTDILYFYDNNGNISQIVYPSGRAVNYAFGTTDKDRVESITENSVQLADDIEYEPSGGIKHIEYGNGLATDISRDQRYQITSLTTQPPSYPTDPRLIDLSYSYDRVGNILGISDNVTPSKNRVFTYDGLYRLDTAGGVWGSLDWGYDANGNRLSELDNSVDTTYQYLPGTDKIDTVGDAVYTYDQNGNITQVSGPTNVVEYVYNSDNRLIEVRSGPVAGSLSVVADYVYDYQGRRIKKIVGSVETVYLYDLFGNLIYEKNHTTDDSSEYVYLGSERIARIDVSGTDEDIYYYHNDHLGSPLRLTTDGGAVVWSADYLPFGQVEIDPASSITNNFRFPGQYYDEETGLYYNLNRYYSKEIGRYITPDPVGLLGGINLFSYVYNNSIRFTDPHGLVSPLDWLWYNLRGPIVVTDMTEGSTTFYPGFFSGENTYSIETRNVVAPTYLATHPWANDEFSTPNVQPMNNVSSEMYGPYGTYIDTGDPRGRDIHGGGTGLPNPFAARQGWMRTHGCTRGQNEDVQELNRIISRFLRNHPGTRIPYKRHR
jgi:RHS repeat-associated protein